jgi:addiction module RelE/StbE family toxin
LRRIPWAPAAADDLQTISEYLKEHLPSLAQSTIQKLYAAACSLKRFPNRGRTGHLPHTRELVMTLLPYLTVYGVERDVINIYRIIHTSEDWL